MSHLLTSTPALVSQSSPFEACSTTPCIFQPGLGSGCLTRTFVSSLPLSLGRNARSGCRLPCYRLMHYLNPTATTSVPTNPLDLAASVQLDPAPSPHASLWSKIKAFFSPQRSHSQTSPERDTLARIIETTTSSPSCQEMVPLVQSTASPTPTVPDNLKLEMAHMIDTGGQPELMEVMPSLIHNADLAIALLNLEYSLSEHQQVDYNEKGESYKRKTPSTLSSRDIILKLASTLHGKKSLHEPIRLLIVATHRDCVEGDLDARVETLNRASYSQHSRRSSCSLRNPTKLPLC